MSIIDHSNGLLFSPYTVIESMIAPSVSGIILQDHQLEARERGEGKHQQSTDEENRFEEPFIRKKKKSKLW